MIRRIVSAVGAAAVSLVFAASAQAYPSKPVLSPLPTYSCGVPTASWTASRPSAGGRIVNYQVTIVDRTAGTSTDKYGLDLSTPLTDLTNNHEYAIGVLALELRVGVLWYSDASYRTFTKTCLQIPQALLQPPRLG